MGDFGVIIAAHSLSASDSIRSAGETVEEEGEGEGEEGGEEVGEDEGEEDNGLLIGTSYNFLRISVGTDPFIEQPSPSHHLINALQCLSLHRVEESPTTTRPDRARVTKRS